jgi:hypothetical protein
MLVNIDDLVFAKVRAKYLEPPGRAADRLIEAAADPHCLDGVTSRGEPAGCRHRMDLATSSRKTAAGVHPAAATRTAVEL